ncbi:MAG: hypothetical protein ACFE9S_17790 [Candidatus Hermodarchaeota archaeon]
MSYQYRCRNCGRPIDSDQQRNFFSYCYDCFRDYKSSKMKQGTAMRIIGIVGIIMVAFYELMFSFTLRYFFYYSPPLRIVAYIIGSIIALLVPILLIVYGTKRIRKWESVFQAKPVAPPQQVISPQPVYTTQVQKNFCRECGAKIGDPNQKYCASCGSEI